MAVLILASLVFVASHLLPSIGPLRQSLINRWGRSLYLGVYSLVSMTTLVFVGWAYANAPYQALWPPVDGIPWVAVLAMLPACVLSVAGLTSANVFSMTVSSRSFDPVRPGIVRLCKHPVPWGLGLWAVSHCVVNGDLASLIVFGLFAGLSALGPVLLNRKSKRSLGQDNWRRLAQEVDQTSVLSAFTQIGAARYLSGLLLYGLLLFGHGPVIGISPLDGL